MKKSDRDNIVRGNKGLAATLGVSISTVEEWRRRGLLDEATVVSTGRVIVYDLDKVRECLNNRRKKPSEIHCNV